MGIEGEIQRRVDAAEAREHAKRPDAGIREGIEADLDVKKATEKIERVKLYTQKLEGLSEKILTAEKNLQNMPQEASLRKIHEQILAQLKAERDSLVDEFSGDTERGSDTLQ